MAKQKTANAVPNRAFYSRMSYLYQAATYLSPRIGRVPSDDTTSKDGSPPMHVPNMARRLVSDMRSVALKTQLRMDPKIKQTVCKYCDALLVEGQTCTSIVENRSKNGKKPWADVLVTKCLTCGREKRFPVSAPRQKRRPQRQVEDVGAKVGGSTVESKVSPSSDVEMEIVDQPEVQSGNG